MSWYGTVWGCHAFYLLTDFIFFFSKLNHWVFLLFILMTNFVGFSSACQDGPIVRWERRCRKPKHKTRGAPVPALCLVCWQSDYERSVSASTAFTDSLLRKGLRSLRGRKSEKGGGGEGENLKEMLLIHSETVNSQPDPTLPKLSLDLTPLISFFHTRSSVGLPSLWGSFFQPLLRKLICFTLHQSLLSLVPFSSLSPFYREPGWSLEEKLTGASADLPLILFVVFTAAQRPLRTLTGCECLSTADSGRVLLASRSTDIHFDAVLWLYLIFIVLYVYRGCMDLCRYCNLNSQTHIYGSY